VQPSSVELCDVPLSRVETMLACDGQTDRRTDGQKCCISVAHTGAQKKGITIDDNVRIWFLYSWQNAIRCLNWQRCNRLNTAGPAEMNKMLKWTEFLQNYVLNWWTM